MQQHYRKRNLLGRWLKQWLLFWLAAVAVMSAGRLVLYLLFTNDTVRQLYVDDIAAVFIKGVQFDSKMASLLTALPFLLGLASLVKLNTARRFDRIHAGLLALLATVLVLATAANVFYFKVYERQFDVFVFGLAEEDTAAVLKTMWADYPVWQAALAAAVFFWFCRRLFAAFRPSENCETGRGAVWLAIAAVPLLALGIRGSVGKFPLRQDEAQVSASPLLNRLVANAPVSLDWARKEYQNSSRFRPAPDDEGMKLIAQVTGRPAASADLAQFEYTVPAADNKQPLPNVVFAVMESMGSHLMWQLHQTDNPQRDLMGALAPHFAQDWVYRRFVSEGDGTSDSLHRLMVRSPLRNLSQSAAKRKHFAANLFAPYLAAGYRVVYITSGNGAWRDFDNFLRHLGVHESADENTLKNRYPEAAQAAATWGVPDEFMFRYAAETLAEAEKSGKPVFIMMMSTTNHPPYQLPPPHQKIQFALTEAEQQRLSQLGQGSGLNEILNTYRYANDRLGRFIGEVKTHAPHTVIAATGDHNMRAIGYPQPQEAALGHAVPFYLYVPEAYRRNAVYRPERVGGHKDIMPTLYEISLPGRRYYRNGCNLTAADTSGNPWCGYGYNHEIMLLPSGYYDLNSQTYRRWTDPDRLTAQAEESPMPSEDKAAAERGRANRAFLEWQLNRMIEKQP